MKPTQAARTFRKIGPKFSAYLVQQKLSRLLHGRRLSRLDDLGQAVVRRMLGDPITIAVDGLRIQGPFDSRWMLYHMKAEIYEPLEVELFKQAVGPGMTVLDVGANIGFYSLLASRAAGNDGVVHAFEADPRNVAHLEANARSNGCSNISVRNMAVADAPGTHVFRMAAKPTHSSLFASMSASDVASTIEVETAMVDDALADSPVVDVIKMDIEGGEPGALRGMTTTLEASRAVKLFIEFEPRALHAANESPEEFLRLLRSLFTEILVIDERRRTLIPLGEATLTSTQSLYCSGGRSS
jgi:FkbM family methyltransferase